MMIIFTILLVIMCFCVGVSFFAIKKNKMIKLKNDELNCNLARYGEELQEKIENAKKSMGTGWIMHPDCKIRWNK